MVVVSTLFLYAYDYSYPVEVNPDEVGQLKNVYAMIQSKSLSLQYFSSYSVWTHYIYIIPTLFYWGGFYLFSDLSTVAELKNYILNNYYQVVPFLRIVSALFFLVSLLAIRKVIAKQLNKIQAEIFFILVALNLLVVINAHYAKHWIVDLSLIFFSLYFYHRYNADRSKNSLLVLSAFLFSFAVLSSYPLIFSGLYFIFISHGVNLPIRLMSRDAVVFVLTFVIMAIYTWLMGFGGLVDGFELQFSMDRIIYLFSTTLDYDPVATVLFLCSVIFLAYKKRWWVLFMLIPYIGYLIFLAFFDAQPRYALFLVVTAALPVSFLLYDLYLNKRKLFVVLIIPYILFNTFLSVSWLNIVSEKDTRVEVRDWLSENITSDGFIIYNTLGFNYLPLTEESILVQQEIAPETISTREQFHIKYDLVDGKNGLILWKIDLSEQYKSKVVEIISSIKKKGYKVFVVNERFGKAARFSQPSEYSYNRIKGYFKLNEVFDVSPFSVEPDNREMIGDIILNFRNILYTMRHLDRPGPVMTVYEVL